MKNPDITHALTMPAKMRGTIRERYKFDSIKMGGCIDLYYGENDIPVDRIISALHAYGKYHGGRFKAEKIQKETENGTVFGRRVWRII